ncbi:MAG: hypothetical protein WDO73_06360 [Ignavibacteriota bacterium]
MLQGFRLTTTFLTALVSLTVAAAADSDRDFSGKWILNADHSEMHALSGEIYPSLTVEQRSLLHVTATTSAGRQRGMELSPGWRRLEVQGRRAIDE